MKAILKTIFPYVAVLYIIKLILDKVNFNGSYKDVIPENKQRSESGSTISDSMAVGIANRLWDAFKLPMWTKDAQVFEELDRLNNTSDFNKVYNRFGVRSYNMTTGSWAWSYFRKYDLVEIMVNELDSSEVEKLRVSYAHLNIL